MNSFQNTVNNMRALFRVFAFLDLIALILMGMQLVYIATHFEEKVLLSQKVEAILMFPMFVLVLIGAFGLIYPKKYAFILYYIQFPFRMYLSVFTLGFITLLPEAFEIYDDKWFEVLLKVCFVGEVVRLYLTILGQRRLTNR
jgi:hypothetical protein